MGLAYERGRGDDFAPYARFARQSYLSSEFIYDSLRESQSLSSVVFTQGVSDTPAWIVSKANQYARDHALTPFSVYQGAWNVLERSFEREIIPMARAEGSFRFCSVISAAI